MKLNLKTKHDFILTVNDERPITKKLKPDDGMKLQLKLNKWILKTQNHDFNKQIIQSIQLSYAKI